MQSTTNISNLAFGARASRPPAAGRLARQYALRGLAAALFFIVALSCAPAQAPVVIPFADADQWVLQKPLAYRSIVVPAGFVTDFASIPSPLCNLIPRTDRYLSAAIVHDFLYWDQSCSREQADRLLFAAMENAGVPPLKREAIRAAVRALGGHAWSGNAADRREGYVRVLPRRYRTPPAEGSWHSWREQLRREHVGEPEYERPSAAACSAADALH